MECLTERVISSIRAPATSPYNGPGLELIARANTGEKSVTVQITSDGDPAVALLDQDAGGIHLDFSQTYITWLTYDKAQDVLGAQNPTDLGAYLGLRSRVIHPPDTDYEEFTIDGSSFKWSARSVYTGSCSNCNWLTVNGEQMAAGSFDGPASSTKIKFTFDKTGLAPGVYTAQVNITLTDPGVIVEDYFHAEDIKVIPVTLVVQPFGGSLPLAILDQPEPPIGAVTAQYQQRLFAVGGDGLYSWGITVGSLPDRLTLSDDGNITGTPSNAGMFKFTVKVHDSSGAAATLDRSISIVSLPHVTTSALPGGAVAGPYKTCCHRRYRQLYLDAGFRFVARRVHT